MTPTSRPSAPTASVRPSLVPRSRSSTRVATGRLSTRPTTSSSCASASWSGRWRRGESQSYRQRDGERIVHEHATDFYLDCDGLLGGVHPDSDTPIYDVEAATHNLLLRVRKVRPAPPAGRTCL